MKSINQSINQCIDTSRNQRINQSINGRNSFKYTRDDSNHQSINRPIRAIINSTPHQSVVALVDGDLLSAQLLLQLRRGIVPHAEALQLKHELFSGYFGDGIEYSRDGGEKGFHGETASRTGKKTKRMMKKETNSLHQLIQNISSR